MGTTLVQLNQKAATFVKAKKDAYWRRMGRSGVREAV